MLHEVKQIRSSNLFNNKNIEISTIAELIWPRSYRINKMPCCVMNGINWTRIRWKANFKSWYLDALHLPCSKLAPFHLYFFLRLHSHFTRHCVRARTSYSNAFKQIKNGLLFDGICNYCAPHQWSHKLLLHTQFGWFTSCACELIR